MPVAEKVKLDGADELHPVALKEGGVAFSVIIYPVTETLSVAVKPDTGTVSDAAENGIVKVLTIGLVESMITVAARLAETFPAASLAQT